MIFRLTTAIPGALIIAFALREIYQDLFHPTATGSLSGWVSRTISRVMHRRPGMLPSVGPLSLVAVILCWALLLALGFALVYWSSFPQDFRVDTGRDPSTEHGFASVLYFSLELVSNIGFGDFVPKTWWLRLLVTAEALVGLALITASVSWIVLLYPALSRMRALARRTRVVAKAAEQTGIDIVSEGAESMLADLALDLIRTRVDLIHFPIIYYFYADNETSSLAWALPRLVQMADSALNEQSDRLRLHGAVLTIALQDVAEVLGRDFLDMKGRDRDAVFRAYRADHVSATTTN